MNTYSVRNFFLITCTLVFIFSSISNAQTYKWKSVQIRGGGFVDGVVYHPTAKGVAYCRTDMGGAYRWNDPLKTWEPLLDWVSYKDVNLMGVESIALDPSNPNYVYLACGTYTTSKGPFAILRSDDRGKTFKRTDVGFKMGGNENGRGSGERMMVDPNNSNIIYIGTRLDGLWCSKDRGATFNRITSFPEIADPPAPPDARRKPRSNGVVFVLFDAKSGSKGKGTPVIYAGTSQKGKDNLFKSTDAGLTWKPVSGQPTQFLLINGRLAADGMLYLTYGTNPGPDHMTDGAVYKLNTANEQWTNITPVKPDPDHQAPFGYAGVAVDPNNSNAIIVSTFSRPRDKGGDDIFRSTDQGKTWKPIFAGGGKYDYNEAPYVSHTGIHWLFDLEIDPSNSNHALFTTGYGLHDTYDLKDADQGKPTTWGVMNKGIEETVALDLLSPPQGAQLVSAIGDYGGFVHTDLDKPNPEGNFINPHFGNTDAVSCAALKSNIMVRVGELSSQVGGGNIGYSLDGGKTWQTTKTTPAPTSKRGYIAVSANGQAWVWTPDRAAPYVTTDNGASWKPVTGLPERTKVIADPVNAARFYAIDLFNGKLFTSDDNGSSFQPHELKLPNGLPQKGNRGDNRGGQDKLYTTPGMAGDLWLPAFDGLYHTSNYNQPFETVGNVQEIHAFGFGRAKVTGGYPVLFLAGTVNNIDGIFKSEDKGKSWARINDDDHLWSLILQLTGDPKIYGRVYVGPHGRGVFYGDIKQTK